MSSHRLGLDGRIGDFKMPFGMTAPEQLMGGVTSPFPNLVELMGEGFCTEGDEGVGSVPVTSLPSRSPFSVTISPDNADGDSVRRRSSGSSISLSISLP